MFYWSGSSAWTTYMYKMCPYPKQMYFLFNILSIPETFVGIQLPWALSTISIPSIHIMTWQTTYILLYILQHPLNLSVWLSYCVSTNICSRIPLDIHRDFYKLSVLITYWIFLFMFQLKWLSKQYPGTIQCTDSYMHVECV